MTDHETCQQLEEEMYDGKDNEEEEFGDDLKDFIVSTGRPYYGRGNIFSPMYKYTHNNY